MTMTVAARSLDNEERSNFRDYMSLLSLSVDAGMVSDEIDALMRDVEALSGDDAVFSMLRHPSVSGGDEWWNW